MLDLMELDIDLYPKYYPLFEKEIMKAINEKIKELDIKYGVNIVIDEMEFTIFIPFDNDRLNEGSTE